MKRLVALIAIPFALLGCGGGAPSAEITGTRIADWTNPEGKTFQMVYVDWKNTGNAPVKSLKANVAIYDASGAPIDNFTNTTIYADNTGIAPGESYSEPPGEGYVVMALTPDIRATRVEATIAGVDSELKY